MKTNPIRAWVLLICWGLVFGCTGREHDPAHQEAAAPAPTASGDDVVAYWTCPMHPSVKQNGPGGCPICGMNLTPVTRRELASGEITVPAAERARLGIELVAAAPRPFGRQLKAQGKVAFDESRLADVTVRVAGYVRELHAPTLGERVKVGAPLVTLESPELLAAQEELLAALQSQNAARATAAPDRADYLVAAARRRLGVWGMSEEAIAAVQKTGRPMERFTLTAPISGVVLERMVVEGSPVEANTRLFRLVATDRVWVEAEVYEADAALLKVGQKAQIELAQRPGRRFSSRVSFLAPELDAENRTVRVRLELPQGDFELKPESFAQVTIEIGLGEHLAVPSEAVLYTGQRRYVFVAKEGGRFEPRPLETGLEEEGYVEVVSGLDAGEEVVAAGTFLVAAEARLKQALEPRR